VAGVEYSHENGHTHGLLSVECMHAGAISNYNRAFSDEIGYHLRTRFKIPDEAAFIISRLVVSIVRQSLLESRTLPLHNLENELVCVLESYIAALKSRGARPKANA
jgi:hypothetical protein